MDISACKEIFLFFMQVLSDAAIRNGITICFSKVPVTSVNYLLISLCESTKPLMTSCLNIVYDWKRLWSFIRLVLLDNFKNMLRQVPFFFLCNSWLIALLIPLYWFSVYKIVSYNIRLCIHLLSVGYSVYRNCTLNAEVHR